MMVAWWATQSVVTVIAAGNAMHSRSDTREDDAPTTGARSTDSGTKFSASWNSGRISRGCAGGAEEDEQLALTIAVALPHVSYHAPIALHSRIVKSLAS